MHGVDVERFLFAILILAEELYGFFFRRGGEGKVAHVFLHASAVHLSFDSRIEHFLLVGFLFNLFIEILRFFQRECFSHLACQVVTLAGVCLVDDYGIVAVGEVLHGFCDTWKLLNVGDDNLLTDLNSRFQVLSCFFLFSVVAVDDIFHFAFGDLELANVVSYLAIELKAVGDHEDSVEHRSCIIEVLEEIAQAKRQPCDGVALARSGGVLDEETMPHAFLLLRTQQSSHGSTLVPSRKNQSL